ncbi:MAG: glutamine--fructose-6-phosphate transaminase (isomerizing) [Candidatus Lokiarchaeota archaeon]|nr:glutamine--fructose-6-phosphate transaminase (isomerizing) [Candidatus Lokiarchaeota archaeon]
MCGIFGIISTKPDLVVGRQIREGLERLEYRGYDSAGIALVNNGKIELRKKSGRIAVINKHGWFDSTPGQFGVGHTRWATHGKPIQFNAHPHMDCTEKIAIVHNGIVENYQDLKKELLLRGHKFKSDTDTEIFPHLIEEFIAKGFSLKDAVIETVKKCHGAYGVVVIHADTPEYMVVARKESPLVIGIIPGETTYCASDIPAFLPLTREAIILDDDEVAILKPGEVEIFRVYEGTQKEISPFEVSYTMDAAQKTLDGVQFPWYMIKELHEVPQKIKEQVQIPQTDLDEFCKGIMESDHVFITAAGSSYYAALAGKFQITKFGGPYIEAILCSEFIDLVPNIPKNSLIIAVSQSGETADTIEAVRHARDKGDAKICSIVNQIGSSLTRYSDQVLVTTAGPEIAVASQKAFCTQVTALTLIGLRIAELYHTLPPMEIKAYRESLANTSSITKQILLKQGIIKELASKLTEYNNIYFLARGISYAAALEGALKLKEVAYIHTESYAAGESKHGPIALIEEGFPVIFVAPPDQTYSRIVGNIMEMKSRGAIVYSVVSDEDENVTSISDYVIRIPIRKNKYAVETSIVPFAFSLQLLAYYISIKKGLDPDKPRNLAKSVTVK